MRNQEEDLQREEEIEEEVDQEEEEAGSDRSICESYDSTILLPQKKKRRTFEIPEVSDDEEEDEGILKKPENGQNARVD